LQTGTGYSKTRTVIMSHTHEVYIRVTVQDGV